MLPVVSDFLASFPDINLRMVLSDRNVNLVDDHVDLAVRIGALPDSMIATRVGSVRRVVCGSPRYVAAHGTPKTPADLADLACVAFAGLAPGTSWTFASRDKSPTQSVPPRCRLNVNTAEAAIDAAIARVGLTHVLCYQVEAGQLLIVLEEFEPEPMPVSLIQCGTGASAAQDAQLSRIRRAALEESPDGRPGYAARRNGRASVTG